MNHLLLFLRITFFAMWLANGAATTSASASSPSETAAAVADAAMEQPQQTTTPTNDRLRFLSDDETYNTIMSYTNKTIPSKCYVAISRDDNYLVVWCDIIVPFGLNVTAEIIDGTCDTFNVTASSTYFRQGVASPIFLPTITEEEKLMGIFNHAYCARMDILYDVNGTGEQISVLDRRFPMEITYQYVEKLNDGDGNGTTIEEELVSATLTDENSVVEEGKRELGIGLGVIAGAVVTLALVAIIYGQKKKTTRRRWLQREAEEEEQAEDENNVVEIAPLSTMTASSAVQDGSEIL